MLIFNIQGQMWIWYPMLYINTMKLTHTLGNGSQLFKGKFKQMNEPVTERKKEIKIWLLAATSLPKFIGSTIRLDLSIHFKILQIINTTSIHQCNFLVL